MPSKTIQLLDVRSLACRTLDHLFFVAFSGSPEAQQLGSWHALCVAWWWHRHSFALPRTDVGFRVLQLAGSRGDAEDLW